jgi:predicted O-methyltransferase YrrM
MRDMSTMRDEEIVRVPAVLDAIGRDGAAVGFAMASEPKTGALLRALVAAKPGGRFLELGTGTGIGTAWLLAGMDRSSSLITVDSDPQVVEVARRHLGHDPRVTFPVGDGGQILDEMAQQFDLIYADAWPGKYTHLDRTLSLLAIGGIYVIDDLLPQANWPEGHAARVPPLIADLEQRRGFVPVKLAWASGLMMLVRTGEES